MKKIMFSDRFGLTQAVIEGRKTMTRRIIPEKLFKGWEKENWLMPACVQIQNESIRKYMLAHAPFQIGEIVAVAQSYHTVKEEQLADYMNPIYDGVWRYGPSLEEEAGWNNKMFVQAELMPHQIRFTDLKVERLHSISDEDCLKEGIAKATARDRYYYHEYKNGMDIGRVHDTPRDAFNDLFRRLSGYKVFYGNPWVYGYEYELVQ